MTSPAQLKYLDAMGIPVWVSRDLIIKENNLTELASPSLNEPLSGPVLKTQTNSTPITSESVNQVHNSALNILNALDEIPAKHKKSTTNEESKAAINKVIIKSVEHAQIAPKSHSEPSVPSSFLAQNILFKSLQHHVYASGCETADWMVIGYSPEPFNGIGQEPFAAEAGELLNNMLRAVGIKQPRSEAYLVNVLDINHSSNLDAETLSQTNLALKKDLLSVINKIKPKIILCVGQIAPQILLNISDPLIIMRSKVHNLSDSMIPCIVTYYPSYLLQKPTDKRKAWDDLKLAMSQLTDDI